MIWRKPIKYIFWWEPTSTLYPVPQMVGAMEWRQVLGMFHDAPARAKAPRSSHHRHTLLAFFFSRFFVWFFRIDDRNHCRPRRDWAPTRMLTQSSIQSHGAVSINLFWWGLPMANRIFYFWCLQTVSMAPRIYSSHGNGLREACARWSRHLFDTIFSKTCFKRVILLCRELCIRETYVTLNILLLTCLWMASRTITTRDWSITHNLQRWVSTKSSISQLGCILIFL